MVLIDVGPANVAGHCSFPEEHVPSLQDRLNVSFSAASLPLLPFGKAQNMLNLKKKPKKTKKPLKPENLDGK